MMTPINDFKSEGVMSSHFLMRALGDWAAINFLLAYKLVSWQIRSIISSLKNSEKYSIGSDYVSNDDGRTGPLATLNIGIVLLGPGSLSVTSTQGLGPGAALGGRVTGRPLPRTPRRAGARAVILCAGGGGRQGVAEWEAQAPVRR